jgi:hypothetical protein
MVYFVSRNGEESEMERRTTERQHKLRKSGRELIKHSERRWRPRKTRTRGVGWEVDTD